MPTWAIAIASALLAVIPVIIWLNLIGKNEVDRSIFVKTFLFGTFSVVPPFILIFIFNKFPSLNIYSLINTRIEDLFWMYLVTNIVVGVVEEIGKNAIVRVTDKRHPEYIQTLNHALKLSVCAGLGFAFAENIFYYFNVWVNPYFTTKDLIATLIFRSLVTLCGHMVFSGIFGYYFGIGKFASDLTEMSQWEGSGLKIERFFAKITGLLPFQVKRVLKNLQGLIIAMGMHACFNASLDMNHKLLAIGIVLSGIVYIAYLMNTASGHLLFSLVKRRAASMAPKDEAVVLELLGMWKNEGKLNEVINICDRLIERDPDNNVVKLFKAKAQDDQKLKSVYTSLKAVFEKQKLPVQANQAANAQASNGQVSAAALQLNDEKVVLEFMDMMYKNGNYKQVLEVANRLLERNPNSKGAQLLFEKAMDQQKMQNVFDSLTKLFAN